jgi:hypothetical protein
VTSEVAVGQRHPFRDVRLHVVTGKGGTGKTTVAGALALALAAGGHRVLLAEVEGRQGIAQLFELAPLPYEERLVATAPGGGEVIALAIDPEEALLEYLQMFYNMKFAGRTLRKMGAVDFATTIAPGMRDVLLTGKVKEAVTREDKSRRSGRAFDAVVMDAPPTGRITRFLNVTSEVAGLAKVGPIRTQSDSVMAVLRSPRTAVHLVTLLEEMPVQETIDGMAELRAAQLPVGAVIVNRTRSTLLTGSDLSSAVEGGVDRAELSRGLAAAGIAVEDKVLAGLTAEAADHAVRIALEAQERKQLGSVGRPTYELPQLPETIDLGALYKFAELFAEQGMTG